MLATPNGISRAYLQDLFQLCKRDLVDRCHGVSRRFCHVLRSTAEAHLPRRRFEMHVYSVVSPHFVERIRSIVFHKHSLRFQTDGRTPKDVPEGSVLYLNGDWSMLAALNECPCREDCEVASRRLIGQCITQDAQRNDWIRIQLTCSESTCLPGGGHFKAIFTARNLLTEPTALSLLHLLHHLSAEAGSCLESLNYYSSGHASPNNSLDLNLELGGKLEDTASTWPRLRCKRLRTFNSSYERVLSNLPLLFSHCHSLDGFASPSSSNLRLLLSTLSSNSSASNGCGNSGCVVRSLKFNEPGYGTMQPNSGEIDSIIEYFRQEKVCFEECTPHVIIPMSKMHHLHAQWPSLCPRMGGAVLSDSWSREVREYCLANEISGERFRVRLVIENCYGIYSITGLHLLFY